jgi:hypothetical protein
MLNVIVGSPTRENPSIESFYLNRKNHYYGLPTQRNFVWDNKRQSLFIHSLLLNYPIGTFYIHERGNLEEFMDGQQRGKTIENMLDNILRLADDIPDVNLMIDARNYEYKSFKIAGKTYDELDEQVRQVLKTRIIVIERYRNLTDEQINEMISRLNNGKQLTKIEKVRMIALKDVQDFVNKIVETNFFAKKVLLTDKGKLNFLNNKMVYQMLIYETGMLEYHTEQGIEKFVKLVSEKDIINDHIRNVVINVIDYLGGTDNPVFPLSKDDFLRFGNIVPIYAIGKKALEDNVSPRKLYSLICSFKKDQSKKYLSLSKRYSITLEGIRYQLDEIITYYNENIDLVDDCVII